MLYEIKDMTRDYDGRRVLDISLSLEEGRVTGILGPNGSGKTTLLEILAFLSRPTSGELLYKDTRVDFDGGDLIGLRKAAVLMQQKPILFTTTVFNNVEFPLKIRNLKMAERERLVNRFLTMVGMEGFSRAKAHKLSGGETQRVAIAQALACLPEVILMDEPTASVDVENSIIIERIIRDINRQNGISVIFTTHDRIQASRLADNIVFIHEGKVSKSINENIFAGALETDLKGKKFCLIRENLKIPVKTEKTGQVRISINPSAVRVFRGTKNIEEMRGIKGRVIQLSDERGFIRAIIDIGVPLTVIMPPDSTGDVIPGIGEDAWVAFSPEMIEVI
ncbi:MAG: ATP-binding cassette domain-containing protein [Deltaproteobacteria bacterium]|nr:ATP-binding cassette domain-containing protein [Deltaproteobacteria bacterium]